MRELSKADILSEADAGTGNRKVDGSRLPLDDLIGRFAARPRVSLNVTVDRGRGEKREKKEERKELQDSRKREGGGFYLARFSWRNEEERREEKIREGRKVFTVFDFVFILHTWREITEREREREV